MTTPRHEPEVGRAKQASLADRIIKWVRDNVRVPEGKDVGKPLILRDWQQAEVRKIYDNPHGTRRAILSFGRKNAKTTLAALLLLVHLAGPVAARTRNAQLYSSAQSRDQAAILFALAAKVVRMSPKLSALITVLASQKTLSNNANGSTYRALSAETALRSAVNASPSLSLVDNIINLTKRVRGNVIPPSEGCAAWP
jgi:phage terminase large subunit-like protein